MKKPVKTVLVTGSAHGLGKAIVKAFLETGWFVIAIDIDDLSMAWMLENEQAEVIAMDITSDASVTGVFSRLKKEEITLDLIINNAGIDRYFPLSEAPVDQFRHVFEVNVFGGYRVNQIFLPLIRQPGGRIIHISSESLNLTVPFMPYPLSKHLVESYAKVLRMELKYAGIDVIVVRPGAIRTRLLDEVSNLASAEVSWKLDKQFKKFATTAAKEIRKTITTEEAARFILKVASIRNPSAIYRINNMLQLRIAALLPFTLWEKLIYRKLL